jgi:DNA-binding transcriptional MerR regulator
MTVYTPAEAATRSGFSLDTLRYYEREGILEPIARTAGGRRAYSDGDLAWLDLVRCLRDTGMPIAELKRYAELCQDDATVPERIAMLEAHDATVRAQIVDLEAQRERIAHKLDYYRTLPTGDRA